ncbi:helix-turn-helix domain-containing protein [Nocardioides coralli]|uniref:helix-turn-helix domain-containing protein n=1 Tax=Nocardioides coralli TaxID=2872154 RepID=UPI001CA3FFAD|nr:helix-turn-helix transcriptional regulator [Nocardioides coralli]QZY30275.1 helix-turn-helix domain-containing protein [Nocardioides coralli]
MDVVEAAILREIDPAELGGRIRAARVAKGWTQTDLAGDLVSVGYVSRLESGQRRPNAEVLSGLAARLGLPVDQLLRGASAREHDEIRLELDLAEFAFENGEAIEAESRARHAIDRATSASLHDLVERGRFLVARTLEQQGAIDEAILQLEPLVTAPEGGILKIQAAIALSRCYRESGDLGLAIETGERVLEKLSGTPLDSADESVQLAVTLAAAYSERGDVGQAVRTCRRAIDKAETLQSPKARASAYWNACILETKQGRIREAVPLAERALALLSEGRDGRNLARLRTELADMQLRLDPPNVEAAHEQLAKAAVELHTSSGGAIDFARHSLSRARALLLEGKYDEARQLAAEINEAVGSRAPMLAADALAVVGQAWGGGGNFAEAGNAYRQAVLVLTGVGSDREAAELWFELAGLLEGVGDMESARSAYRSAAASAGLRSRPVVRLDVESRQEI